MSRALPRNRWDLVAQRFAAARRHEHQSISTGTDVVNDGFLRATKGVVAKYFTQYGEIRQTKIRELLKNSKGETMPRQKAYLSKCRKCFYNARLMQSQTYTRAQQLHAILAKRIAVLDGAMGTMIQRYKLSEAQYRGERFKDFHKDVKGNNELLSLTRPEVIRDIHEGYLAAGADLIETNTFGATTIAQADYDMADLAYEMNVASARIAREACDKYLSLIHI